MQSQTSKIVVLGTGGTIAGTAEQAGDNVGYSAAQIGVARLVEAVPALRGLPLEFEQVAQIDSKDMGFEVWRTLAITANAHLARPDVGALVITHGTDTLEETAYFLQRVLAPSKPVVLTAAMRPATSLLTDGPQNLVDAMAVAREPGARGVVTVMAGRVHGPFDLRKRHAYRLDAMDSGDAGVLAEVEEGRVRRHRDWPEGVALGVACLPSDAGQWPLVEIVGSHVGADPRVVAALRFAGVDGLVVACTGNGSIQRQLELALLQAQAEGVAILRATRTLGGSLIDPRPPSLPSAGALTPVQARIELLLRLLSERSA